MSLQRHLRGKLAFLEMVRGRDDPLVRRLFKQFNVLCPELAAELPGIKDLPSSPLRGYRSPSMTWEDHFRRLTTSVHFLEITRSNGEPAGATAFLVAANILATAGHNLTHGDIRAGIDEPIPTHKIAQGNRDEEIDVGLLAVEQDKLSGTPLISQCRIPEVGEQVAAIGFPSQPLRWPTLSLNVGIVESLPTSLKGFRYIQISFQSGGGLSGAPLIDRGGHVLGIVVGNVAAPHEEGIPTPRNVGQAAPFEYLYDLRWPRTAD